ncbi:MAG: Plastocyanin [Verrucomicrobia bacterium]|nr:MAG: Plastocyanin [Verrucomicrobiota bacterium]
MIFSFKKTILAGFLFGTFPALGADPAKAENTVLFYGNSLVEKLMEGGELEACLQLAHPDASVVVRSLAWTGDEVGYRLRPEGYVEHMKGLLAKWPAKTVVIGFGNNESFQGDAGLVQFKADWEVYLREIKRLHPGAGLVLLSPVEVQSGGALSLAERTRDVLNYGKAIEEIAAKHGALFVDLGMGALVKNTLKGAAVSVHGIALSEEQNRKAAWVVARAMLGGAVVAGLDPARVREVAKAAALKAGYVADVVRPKNGVVYYGVRKRADEYEAEIPRYHALIQQADEIIHGLVREPKKRFSDYPLPWLPALPEGKSVPDRYSGGVLKSPAEQQKDITVAEGYRLNCFASEADFPELKAPVQMSFDARGRLWVVTMPSFPHTVPGARPDDKILILEDADHDGKADKCTVFAGGFDALDGVAFHERGVIVSAQPRLLLLKDNDGDGRADTQEELLRGVDVTDSHHGGMIATDPLGCVIFSDGVFHRSQFETPFGVVRGIDSTTYRFDLATGRVQTEWQGLTPNPWKVAFDRFGNIFQRFGGGHVLDGLPLTWTPLGVYHAYGNGMVVNYGKGSALSVVSSPNFPDRYQQGVVSAALLGSYTVSISASNGDSGGIVGEDRLDLLTSQNSAFRPVDTAFGMDGALYVSDFSSRIIGHAQHPMRDPQWNHTLGRIWRVVAADRTVAKDWPRIEGAPLPELLTLLTHSQDLVREHARIELRKLGAEVVPAVDAWIGGMDLKAAVYEQALLEAVWVLHTKGQVRLDWLKQLMQSQEPRMRAAAVQMVRYQGAQIPEARIFLGQAARDPHPRVRMAVVNAVSRLRAELRGPASLAAADPHPAHAAHGTGLQGGGALDWEGALEGMSAEEPVVRQMVLDLKAGTQPTKGRSVPVLEVSPATEVLQWLAAKNSGVGGVGANSPSVDKTKAKDAAPKATVFRTLIESQGAQTVLLSVKHGFLDISANGVQLLTADSPYSSQQQVQIELQKGLNLVEVAFRKLRAKDAHPPVFIYDMTGQVLSGARFAKDEAELQAFWAAWESAHAADANALRVQAVPNLMQFSPKEIRVKAGQPVRLVFENPDLMQHNLVLVEAGAEEEVGALADQMAAKPEGFAKQFVPESPKILHATPLVNPNGRTELLFTAPAKPGSYPYLCTFPGHWRVMRGVLVVE